MDPTRRKTNQQGKAPPFVMLPWKLLNSAAYISLTPSAAKALPYFIGKDGRAKKAEGRDYSGEIEFTYAEAQRLGFAARTFSRIIGELIETGFIIQSGYGGLRGFCKSNNKFKLSQAWIQYGLPDYIPPKRYPSEPKVCG